MLNYNYQEAINMRGQSTQSLGYPGQPTQIDFRLSINITSNDPGIDFDWGNIPECKWMMMNIGIAQDDRSITKSEWKKQTSAWKLYMKDCYDNFD